MRMVVTAKSAKVYGKTLSRGTEFEVPDKEGRVFEALGRARPLDEQSGPRRSGPRYNRRDMRAEG